MCLQSCIPLVLTVEKLENLKVCGFPNIPYSSFLKEELAWSLVGFVKPWICFCTSTSSYRLLALWDCHGWTFSFHLASPSSWVAGHLALWVPSMIVIVSFRMTRCHVCFLCYKCEFWPLGQGVCDDMHEALHQTLKRELWESDMDPLWMENSSDCKIDLLSAACLHFQWQISVFSVPAQQLWPSIPFFVD